MNAEPSHLFFGFYPVSFPTTHTLSPISPPPLSSLPQFSLYQLHNYKKYLQPLPLSSQSHHFNQHIA